MITARGVGDVTGRIAWMDSCMHAYFGFPSKSKANEYTTVFNRYFVVLPPFVFVLQCMDGWNEMD